jgi:pyruvate,orthophosphate dikinase
MSQQIYRFEDIPRLKGDVGSSLPSIIGSKATYLSDMIALNFPGHVPRGFVLTSSAWQKFIDGGGVDIPNDLWDETLQAIKLIEDCERLQFASPKKPLLLSVRGDSSVYLTGMLDAVTNVGLNDLTARALERTSRNRPYVWDCYRRLVEGFGVVVLRISVGEFAFELEQFKRSRNLRSFEDFTTLDYVELTKINKAIIVRKTGRPFPQDPFEQLRRIMAAVFASTQTERVSQYRKALNIGPITGSLIIQPMVFGNNSFESFGVVLSSRDLVTGEANVIGEFVVNGTTSDVWTAARESCPLAEFPRADLAKDMVDIAKLAEKHFKHPVFADFIIQDGKSFLTQVAPAWLTATGRFRSSVDLVSEGTASKKEALKAIEVGDIIQLLSKQQVGEAQPFCTGWRAGNECVVGKLCLTPEQVYEAKRAGESAIFVKHGLTSADFDVILAASGIVTTSGSNLSFAAALARLFRKTAAIGCSDLQILYSENMIKCNDATVAVGADMAINPEGLVISHSLETRVPELISIPHAQQVLRWADEVRQGKIAVYTTAQTPEEVKLSVEIESDGVGQLSLQKLFTEEHNKMFAEMRSGITEDLISQFEEFLTVLLGAVFEVASCKTITIELCDPDFASYLPSTLDLAREIGVLKGKKEAAGDNFDGDNELAEKQALLTKLRNLKQPNIAIGCRGVRLLLAYAELLEAQFRAIAFAVKSARGKNAEPKIRVIAPFVSDAGEVKKMQKLLDGNLEQWGEKAVVGALVETPRSCLTAGRLAEAGSFLLLSIPRLVELTFGIIQSDAGWMKAYRDRGIFKEDIFGKIEQQSVGVLMKRAVEGAKQAKSDGEIGIYNEEFGNPEVLASYIGLGINGIICKPNAVPIARLGAAKALLQ